MDTALIDGTGGTLAVADTHLCVADASGMPAIVSSNINDPTLMISERAAQRTLANTSV